VRDFLFLSAPKDPSTRFVFASFVCSARPVFGFHEASARVCLLLLSPEAPPPVYSERSSLRLLFAPLLVLVGPSFLAVWFFLFVDIQISSLLCYDSHSFSEVPVPVAFSRFSVAHSSQVFSP
jgi:hypothetical protein